KEHSGSGKYDLLVVDCAPTGETLRLLSLPETFGWVMKLVRNVEKFAVAPLIRPLSKISSKTAAMVAPPEVFSAIDNLFTATDGIIDLLGDNTKSTVRLVMNPEKMVIKESMRALTYLNLYGITVDRVIINRIFPEDKEAGYLNEWKGIQHKYVAEIDDAFAPIPISKVPMFSREVVGLDALRLMAIEVYGDLDPLTVFFNENPVEIKKTAAGHFQMRMKLPFLNAAGMSIALQQQGDDLTVRIGDNQKTVTLPTFLAGLRSDEAYFEGQWLCIDFKQGEAQPA
ncbi:MAG: ArsA family ATPase, partial [Rhizobacter sp.]|nr:ArsA family ATPase [Chlorobiales bacterium]